MDLLPNEILQRIFSYLKVSDKLSACIVCKRWLNLFNYKHHLDEIEVFINSNSGIEIFSFMSRDFLSFTFTDIIINENSIKLFQQCASHVEKISLIRCKVNKNDALYFNNITFENLRILKVVECSFWTLFSSFPNLSELYLSGNSTISDEGIAVLKKTMKHLTTLHLPSNLSFDPITYERFYSEIITFETNPSSVILSFPAVLNFISERAATLTELAFTSHFYAESQLILLSCVENLQLINISLYSSFEDNINLVRLFQNQQQLKVLNLCNFNHIDNRIIMAVYEYLPNIEEIKMENCKLSDLFVYRLFGLKMLKLLDIGKCFGFTSSSFCQGVSFLKCKELSYLDIDSINVPEAVLILPKKCRYLTRLNVANTSITDEHVHVISEFLHLLESLSLCYNNISDHGLNRYEFLQQNSETVILNNRHKSISNLKRLEILELQACDITDQGAIAAITFKWLKMLNLNHCTKISRMTIEALFQQNPNLNEISWNCLVLTPDMTSHIVINP